MNVEKVEISGYKIKTKENILLTVEITESNLITMSWKSDSGRLYRYESATYFDTFQKLRDQLLADGIGLKCYGSLINAHASAMLENVPKVYLLQMGQKPKADDIVNIFDYTDINQFPTTEEQITFSQQWFDSL